MSKRNALVIPNVYYVECRTPHLWRELKRLITASPSRRWGHLQPDGAILVHPDQEEGFRDLLSACEGRIVGAAP